MNRWQIVTGCVRGLSRPSFTVPAVAALLLGWSSAVYGRMTVGGVGLPSPITNSPAMRLTNNFGGAAFGRAKGFDWGAARGGVADRPRPYSAGKQGFSTDMPSGRGAARGASAPMVGGTVFLGAGTSATELLDPNFRSPSFKLLVGVESLVKSGYNPAIPGTRVGLALAQSRFSSWGPPEVISKRSTYALPHTQPADGEAAAVAAPRMAMQDLVRNRLDARREVYEHRARQAFKAADYHEACDQLALADATVMHDPERRLQMKLWFVYAAIAGEQFEEAAKTLEWILMRDPSQGASVVAVLNQYRDIAPLYGNPQDMIDHATALELYASRTRARSTPASGALRAIMAWGRADPANAKYHARQLADEIRKALQADRTRENDPRTTCWLRLYDYMQLTEGGEQPVLKQEEPREAGKRPMRAEPGSLTLRALSLPSP